MEDDAELSREDEAELSREQQLDQLQMIKAKTMYEMVDELEDGSRKILFLTNAQAELLAASGAALQRMLDALEIPTAGPGAAKLVINMLESKGLSNQLNDHWWKQTELGPRVGRRRLRPPFVNDEDESRAYQRLDSFMSDVIIPLAARTNAIVMVNAFPCMCLLTQSFQRMVALQKAKWGGKPPFWVFAMTKEVLCMYGNTNPDAEWRKVRNHCRAWRLREPKILETFRLMPKRWAGDFDNEKGWSEFGVIHDLDPNASVMIINDCVHKNGKELDDSAFFSLRTELLRFLASSLPSLALQTGSLKMAQGLGMQEGVSLVQAKVPLMNIDLRERQSVKSRGNREQLIQAAKDDFDKFRSDLVQRPSHETGRGPLGLKWEQVGTQQPENGTEINDAALAAALQENLELGAETDQKTEILLSKKDVLKLKLPPLSDDCYIQVGKKYFKPEKNLRLLSWMPFVDNLLHCNIAWFLAVLKGDGDPHTPIFCQLKKGKGSDHTDLHLPLYKAVLQAQSEAEAGVFHANENGTLQVATGQEIDEVSKFLADRYYQDYFLGNTKAQETSSSYAEAHMHEISTLRNEIRTLLNSPNLFFLNVHSPTEVAEKLVRQIVRLDRLPANNSLEGLQLLQEAWCEYDIAMHLANRYKVGSKLLFVMQLVLGWVIVFIGTAKEEFDDEGIANTSDWRHVVFGLTLGSTLLISLDAMFNAKTRWRQLRSSAGSLESLLYLYRTRVGQFELDPGNEDSRQPELELCAALKKWRLDLVAGGDLQLSSIRREHPETIYFHEQTPNARRPRAERAHPIAKTRGQPTPSGGGSAGARGARPGDGEVLEMSVPPERDAEKGVPMGPTSPQLDDFYSPQTPSAYVDIRIKRYLSFYKQRIPQYARDRLIIKGFLVLLTIAASAVSAYGFSMWALVIASAAAALTSWTEFADTGRKVERYTRAVVELDNLVSHWKSLTEVDKASPVTIFNVVMTGESIISDERVAWVSTAQKSSTEKDGESDEGRSDRNQTGMTAKANPRQTATTNKVYPS